MKAMKRPKGTSDIIKSYPLVDLVDGWFFRCEEVSQFHYAAEGCDLFGHVVSAEDSDYDEAIEKVIKYSNEIIELGNKK